MVLKKYSLKTNRLNVLLCQGAFDCTQVSYLITQYEWIGILNIKFNNITQICTFCKCGQILQTEDTLNNFVVVSRIFGNLNTWIFVTADGSVLGAEITFAAKGELITNITYFNVVRQIVHITNDLLEVNGRHSNNGLEVSRGNANIEYINVKHGKLVCCMDILVLVGDEITKNQELHEKFEYEQKFKPNEDFEVRSVANVLI